MDDRVTSVRKNIGIKPIHSEIDHAGGLPGFFISFQASDPHVAQEVCGQIRSLFVGDNLRQRQESAQGTTSFLATELAEAKSNLDEQDAKLATFERKYMGQLPSEAPANMDMLTSLNTQLEAATQELTHMEQDKTYQDSMLAQQLHDLAIAPAARASTDPRQLQLQTLESQQQDLAARYTSDYPDLVDINRKIADLKAEVARNPAPKPVAGTVNEPVQLQQLRAAIRASEQGIIAKRTEQLQLQDTIRMYQGRIASSPLVDEEYKQLTRDYQTVQKSYDDLLQKMSQSKMATDLESRQQGEHFRVMDEPDLPDAPASPKRGIFALAGLAVGLLLGLCLAAFLEYRNTSIRSERDVYSFLKLPTLATISLSSAAAATAAHPEKKPRRSLFGRKLAADTGARG